MRERDSLWNVRRELQAAVSVKELLTATAELAPAQTGCTRALVATVAGAHLQGDGTGRLLNAESDLLRRRLLAAPVALTPRCLENTVIRAAEAGRLKDPPVATTSVLHEALALDHPALAPIMPEKLVLALLVVDRRTALDGEAWGRLQHYALAASGVLESLILRLRMREFDAEMRHFSQSARALIAEALDAPLALPSEWGGSSSFALSVGPQDLADLHDLFTAREITILEQFGEGKTNAEIALVLQVSPETVKKSASTILRKLGVSSRAEAAARYVRLSSGALRDSA